MWKRLFSVFVLYAIYLMLGTCTFFFLEAQDERNVRNKVLNFPVIRRTVFALNETSFSKSEIFRALEGYHYSHSDHHLLEHNETFGVDYMRSMFFSLTLVTTIGYGNVAPKTTVGQAFCVFYAFFGIPFHCFLVMLISDQYKEQSEEMVKRWRRRWPRAKNVEISAKACCVLIALCVFLILPSVIFVYTEEWTFLEGLYYSVVTLTTVGLGDYVAGFTLMRNDFYWAYILVLSVWVIFGLAYVSLLLSSMHEWMQKRLFGFSKCFNNLDTVVATPVVRRSRARQTFLSSGSSLSAANQRSWERVLNLGDNDEVTEEDLRIMDIIIEEFEERTLRSSQLLERSRHLLSSAKKFNCD